MVCIDRTCDFIIRATLLANQKLIPMIWDFWPGCKRCNDKVDYNCITISYF